MPGDEHDRRRLPFGKLSLQIEPVNVRQLEVEDEARRRVRLLRVEKLRRRGERGHLEAGGREQATQGGTNAGVVIHDKHGGAFGCHAGPTDWIGSFTVKVIPNPSLRSADSVPS